MNTAILITARLKSTRLPKKAIKDICGKPMIVHLLDRLKLAGYPIVICTSALPEDDPLVKIAKQEQVEYYRGHPDDVLLRLTMAAAHFGVEAVVNCTADNPFVDPGYIVRLLDFHWRNKYDFSKIDGLPFGTFSYALSTQAMARACEITVKTDTEMWGGYFTETGLFSWGALKAEDYWPELRLTVDTPEDFALISEIFNELYKPNEVFTLKEIISLCRERPDLVAINAHVKQKQEVLF